MTLALGYRLKNSVTVKMSGLQGELREVPALCRKMPRFQKVTMTQARLDPSVLTLGPSSYPVSKAGDRR